MPTNRVIWIIHAACPSQCTYCGIETQQARRSVDAAAAEQLARDIVRSGFREVTLVGGEPLLYPHLSRVLEVLAGRVEVAVFTGGIPGAPRRSLELIRRGVDRVVFSVDAGVDANNDLVRGRKGITRDVLALAEAIRDELPHVGLSVNTVVSRANVEVLDTVWQRFRGFDLDLWSLTLVGDNFGISPQGSFLRRDEVESYYLQTLPRLARSIPWKLIALPIPLPFLERGVPIERWDREADHVRADLERELDRFAAGDNNASFVEKYGCPLVGRDVSIGVQGELYPCSQAPILSDTYVVGDARDGIARVLDGPATRDFADGVPHAPCRRCWAPSNVPPEVIRRLLSGSAA